ncbi:cell wall-binding repeat-containing protein [Bacillus coahuilensis]|uniref:cell wall-binding repeat-containing protein n=1 Tax=Bacillus coahuilensis TaxID=408580 RepID=UPI0001850E0B|nr:cell wall-binding repeat-containing protein [Bacillus coahuilensis]
MERIAGSTRYETSINIAEQLPDYSEVFITTGENFPDALSIASIAANKGMPIILTPSSSILTLRAVNAINNAKDIFAVGGEKVLPNQVLSPIDSYIRIDGNDRYETSLNVLSSFDISTDQLFLSTGEQFADALTGSVLAAKNRNGVLLIPPTTVQSSQLDYIEEQEVQHLITLGGSSAVSEEVLTRLEAVTTNSKEIIDSDLSNSIDSTNGQLNGLIKSSNALLNSKTNVKAYNQNNELIEQMSVDTSGKFSLSLPSGLYSLEFSNSNQETATYSSINVQNGESQNLQAIQLFPNDSTTLHSIDGIIQDSHNGLPVEAADISIRSGFGNISSEPLFITKTTTLGKYTFPQLKQGLYTVHVTKEGYMDNHFNIMVGGIEKTEYDGILSTTMEEDEKYRLILSWENDFDLDAHLTGPSENDTRFHLYWNSPIINGIAKFQSLDQKTGTTPETISLFNTSSGTYHYYVFNYSYRLHENNSALSISNAKVEVYQENALTDVNFIPYNQIGKLWNAYTITNHELLASTSLTDGYTFMNSETDLPIDKLMNRKK